MKSKRRRIFDIPTVLIEPPITPLQLNQEVNPISINPKPEKKSKTLRSGVIRSNKAYHRASSEEPSSTRYTYKLPNHVRMQGTMVDCFCQAMGCNIVDISQEEHCPSNTIQLKSQRKKLTTRQSKQERIYSLPKEKDAMYTIQVKKKEGEKRVPIFNAICLPSKEIPSSRKNIFQVDNISDHQSKRRSVSLDNNFFQNVEPIYSSQNRQGMGLQTIKQQTQTYKMNPFITPIKNNSSVPDINNPQE